MIRNINAYKGIHPGKIVKRCLKKRGLSQCAFAELIHISRQSVNAVITGRRPLTGKIALKIEKELGYEEGFLLILQTAYQTAEYKRKEASASVTGIPNIRRILFWDTDFDKLDWGRYRRSVIQRVYERGNETEIEEINRFYHIQQTEMNEYRSINSYRVQKIQK